MAQGIGVLVMPVLTRLYSPADFALQSLFLQLAAFAVVLLTWRYEYFVQLPKEDSDADSLVILVLCMGIGGAAIATPVIWLFQRTLAYWIGEPALAIWLVFVPATASLMGFSIAMQHFAQRYGQYREASLSELAHKVSYVGTALAGYWILPGPAGLMLTAAASSIGRIVWLSRHWGGRASPGRHLFDVFRSPERKGFKSLRRVAATYFHLSGSMIVSHLLMSCTAIIPSIYIARAYGTEHLGQFALSVSTIYLPSGLIGNAIGQVYYQRAAETWAAGRSFASLWRTTAWRLLLFGLPIYTILALVSPLVYPFIFGARWLDAGKYASLISISAFFSFISSPLDRACLVVGAWKYIPLWHAARTLSTGFVVWLSWSNNWGIRLFVIALVIQMSVLYLIDYWAEYRFALRRSSECAA